MPPFLNTKPLSVLLLHDIGTGPHAYFFGRHYLTVLKMYSLHTCLRSTLGGPWGQG